MGDSMARKSIPQRKCCFSLLELQPLHCLMLGMSTALCTINDWLIAAYNTAYIVQCVVYRAKTILVVRKGSCAAKLPTTGMSKCDAIRYNNLAFALLQVSPKKKSKGPSQHDRNTHVLSHRRLPMCAYIYRNSAQLHLGRFQLQTDCVLP